MENYNIEKTIWTESDFDNMGWHDASLGGMIANPDKYEYLIDLDYIFKWIPSRGDRKVL
jgi:hypothetical protein